MGFGGVKGLLDGLIRGFTMGGLVCISRSAVQLKPPSDERAKDSRI